MHDVVSNLAVVFYTLDGGHLLNDASDESSGNSTATFADIEALALLNGESAVKLAHHFDIVAGHDHLVFLEGIGILGPAKISSLIYLLSA
jgi:hypothetical protein